MSPPMPSAVVTIACDCGTVSGHAQISPQTNPVLCFCTDCQAWQHYLGRPGNLTEAGGSYILQSPVTSVHIGKGHTSLLGMRLTPGGVGRWSARCCGTPIGTAPATRHLPFVGLNAAAIRPDGDASLPSPGDAGATLVFTATAHDAALRQKKAAIGPVVLWILKTGFGGRLRGEHRQHPFFEAKTGRPIGGFVAPDPSKRAAAYRSAGKPPASARPGRRHAPD